MSNLKDKFVSAEIETDTMKAMEELKAAPGYWYLATPYSHVPGGLEVAFWAACRLAALLTKVGVKVFCPIAHSHPIAAIGEIDPTDHTIWLAADQPLMDSAYGLIVAAFPGLAESKGVEAEVKCFAKAGKPIVAITMEAVMQLEVMQLEKEIGNGNPRKAA